MIAAIREFDRLPPHDLDAEACCLGSMMLEPTSAIADVMQVIRDKDAFFQTDHQIIFEHLVALYNAGKAIDAIVLRAELQQHKLLEEIGGSAYLAELLNTVPSAAHAAHYAQIVADKYTLRRLIVAANDTLRDAYGASGDEADHVASRAAERFIAVGETQGGTYASTAEQCGAEAMAVLEGRQKPATVYPTGWHELDEMMDGGFRGGELIIVAARPSMGKTAFATVTALNMLWRNTVVDFYSMEMSRAELWTRLLAAESGIDFRKLRKGMLTHDERNNAILCNARLMQAPLLIDETTSLTKGDAISRLRSGKVRRNINVAFFDYLGLFNAPKADRYDLALGEITKALKSTAKSLNIPIVLLCQLSRSNEKDRRKPRMSDLRDSGNIEQDADVVMLLHREDYYHKDDANYAQTNILEVILEKQRNGPTGPIQLIWDGSRMRPCNKNDAPNI